MKLCPNKGILFFIFIALILLCEKTWALPQIDADYEKDVLTEKGWMKYLTMTVKNTGDETLNNVTVYLEDGHTEWFEVRTNKTNLLPNESKNFTIKLYVPSIEEVGSYPFLLILKSDEIAERKTISLRIFSSKSDMLLYQIQDMRKEIDTLREEINKAETSGKNVSRARLPLEGAESIMSTTEKYVINKMFNDAVDGINNVNYLLKEAEYELSVAPEAEVGQFVNVEKFDWSLIIIFSITIVVIFISFRNKRIKSREIGKILKGPELRIKKFIARGIGKGKVEMKLEELNKSQRLLDEEYKKKLISKESYEELSALNQEKIIELEQKMKK